MEIEQGSAVSRPLPGKRKSSQPRSSTKSSKQKKSPAGNSTLSDNQIEDLTSWIFSIEQAAECIPIEATLCKARAERATERKFSATDCGILSEVLNAYDRTFLRTRQKEQESCICGCLDETTWKFYSRKIIPGTLNRRTILGWTTARGRIGSRGSKRTSRNGAFT